MSLLKTPMTLEKGISQEGEYYKKKNFRKTMKILKANLSNLEELFYLGGKKRNAELDRRGKNAKKRVHPTKKSILNAAREKIFRGGRQQEDSEREKV